MEYRLDELFDLQMGKTPSRNNPSYWETEDNKWISISDLTKMFLPGDSVAKVTGRYDWKMTAAQT